MPQPVPVQRLVSSHPESSSGKSARHSDNVSGRNTGIYVLTQKCMLCIHCCVPLDKLFKLSVSGADGSRNAQKTAVRAKWLTWTISWCKIRVVIWLWMECARGNPRAGQVPRPPPRPKSLAPGALSSMGGIAPLTCASPPAEGRPSANSSWLWISSNYSLSLSEKWKCPPVSAYNHGHDSHVIFYFLNSYCWLLVCAPHYKLSSPGGQELFFNMNFPCAWHMLEAQLHVCYINKYIALAVRKKNEQTRDIDRKY